MGTYLNQERNEIFFEKEKRELGRDLRFLKQSKKKLRKKVLRLFKRERASRVNYRGFCYLERECVIFVKMIF